MVVDAFRTQALGGSAFLVEAVNLFSWLQPDSPPQAMWGPGVQMTSWSDRDSGQSREIAQGQKKYTPSRAAVSRRRVMIISDNLRVLVRVALFPPFCSPALHSTLLCTGSRLAFTDGSRKGAVGGQAQSEALPACARAFGMRQPDAYAAAARLGYAARPKGVPRRSISSGGKGGRHWARRWDSEDPPVGLDPGGRQQVPVAHHLARPLHGLRST
jgi:hypothetical protein